MAKKKLTVNMAQNSSLKWPFGSIEGAQIELKWQDFWKNERVFRADDTSKKEKFYALVEFPYPSGDLHMGHWYAFAPADVYARFKRMKGYEVLFPIGFDAFGLPAENAAIQRNIHPKDWTYGNIERMMSQFQSMGPSFDWDRVLISCDPEYYRWTQWMFLKCYAAGLAYRAKIPANWCPKCQTVLANEQVEAGKCWRHNDAEVIQKEIDQWLFKITAYAEKLIWPHFALRASRGKSDGNVPDWPKSVVEGQNNWIGKSEGMEITFKIDDGGSNVEDGNLKVEDRRSNLSSSINHQNTTLNPQSSIVNDVIKVFTVYPETIFGVTFMVIAPEHELVDKLTTPENLEAVKAYVKQSRKKSAMERQVLDKEKSGVFTGSYCINPANRDGAKIPIWVADYVIATYGTGAVMGVPGSDHRDFAFAKKYGIGVIRVIAPPSVIPCRDALHDSEESRTNVRGQAARSFADAQDDISEEDVLEEGILVNSGQFTGLKTPDPARSKVKDWMEKEGFGTKAVQYHLHDWTISRQRYWGAPIPMIHCDHCGIVPVPEKDLPVELPYEVDYTPKGTSPLGTARDWVKVKCPSCGAEARRDTDTMDTFVDSSWYFFRFVSPHFDKGYADHALVKRWLPIDIYFGGAEHTLGHTMYARFFTKVLHDLGYSPYDEFAKRRVHHGIIMAPDGYRMSKSRGNVVNPDDEVKKYGSDTVRLYLCFMSPHEAGGPWDPRGIMGVNRFLKRVWNLVTKIDDGGSKVEDGNLKVEDRRSNLSSSINHQNTTLNPQPSIVSLRIMHKTIKGVTEDLEALKFNTAIAKLMEWLNYLCDKGGKGSRGNVGGQEIKTLLLLLAPFAPHMTEELFQVLQSEKRKVKSEKFESIHIQPWPTYDSELVRDEEVTIPVQVNGRVRDVVRVVREVGEVREKVEKLAKESEKVGKYLDGAEVKKVVFVPGRLINFVTE